MKRSFLAAAAAVLACSGVGAAFAVAGSGSNVACATTPAHTVAVDGSAVTTTAGDVECATAPTVTVTVTQPGTTTAPTTTDATTNQPPSYLFDDEFNGAAGAKPSSTLWGAKTGASNGSASWNGWSNVSEDGQGNLVITAQKNSSGTWTSAFISGKTSYVGPHDLTVRAKVACGAGAWSAPAWEWQYPYGANAVENDDVEQLGKQPADYHTTLHSSTAVQSGSDNPTGMTLCNGFHVYEAKVYADHADYLIDGILVHTITPASLGGAWPFTTTALCANIDLNMGGWGGTIGVAGPVQMLVDYIRVSALG